MSITLSRIILFGQDIERLKNFYQQNFHFDVTEEIPNEWVVLKTGQMEIALHKIGDGFAASDEPFKADSNTKLVFEISTGLEAFREKLQSNGVLVRELKSFPGFPYLFCDGEDPEGNVFQLMQKLG